MATIPTGNFGTRIAASPGRVQLRTEMPILDAQDRVLAVAGRIGEDMQRREDAERKERERAEAELRDKADQAQTIAGVAEVQSSLKAKRDEIVQGIATRQIDKAEADQRWRDESSKVIASGSKLLPQSHAQVATARLQEHAFGLGDGIRSAVQRQDMEDTRAGLMTYLEATEREVLRDPNGAKQRAQAAIEQLGPWAGLGADDRQRLAQGFREKAAFNVAGELVRTARDDMAALDKVLTTIKSPEFADLDPTKLGQLEQQVLARKQYLLHQEQTRIARAEALAARRDREAESAFKAAQGLIDSGAVPDEKFLAQVQGKMAGTAYAPALTQLLQQASENAGFAQLPPQQQQATLLALRSKANAEGSNPQLEARMQHLERIANESGKQLKDDPLVYAANRRLIGPVQPLQFTDVPALVQQMGSRVEQAQTVAARVGRPVSPLLASEAQQLSEVLKLMPIEQREQALQTLARTVPDAGMVRAMASQIEPKDRTLALAMFAAGKRAPGGESPTLLILRAGDAVSAGRVKESDEPSKLAMQDIAQRLSAVPWATPQARDAAIDATHRIWLGLRDQRQDSVRKAIDIATGGLAEWADSKVPLPYGMGEREFTKAMRDLNADRLAVLAGGETFSVNGRPLGTKELAAGLPQAKLIPVDDGVYALQLGGGIVQSRGAVFRLRLGR